MENINTYSDTMNTANLFRNANFSILQEKSDQFIEKQKETKEKIEGSTLPFEIPVLDHTLGNLGKKALEKMGLRSAEDEDTITRSLVKKGLSAILDKAGIQQPNILKPKLKKKDDDGDEDDADDAADDAADVADGAAADTAGAGSAAADTTAAAMTTADIDQATSLASGITTATADTTTAAISSAAADTTAAAVSNTADQLASRGALRIISGAARNDFGGGGSSGAQIGDVIRGVGPGDPVTGAAEESSGLSSDTAASRGQAVLEDFAKQDGDLTTNTTLDDTASTAAKSAAKTAAKTEIEQQGKSEAEKLAEKAALAEAEGGGPEDIAGDLVAGGLAIASLFASIFGKKIKHPDVGAEAAKFSINASQGFGLSGT